MDMTLLRASVAVYDVYRTYRPTLRALRPTEVRSIIHCLIGVVAIL